MSKTDRNERSNRMNSFSRGAELWVHQARLMALAIWFLGLLSFLIGLAAGGLYFWTKSSLIERYAMERNFIGETRLFLMMTAADMELHVGGERRMLPVQDVVLLTDPDTKEGLRKLRNAGVIGTTTALAAVVLVGFFWWTYGKDVMLDQRLRGARLVDGRELKRLLEVRQDFSPYSLADVPLRKGSETLHALIGGAQGTGKSQQFFNLMGQVRARGKRAIVYDPTGEFTRAFFREGVDVLMNPLDKRSPNWNVWGEISQDYHYDNVANGLIPEPAEADPFWAKAARMVLKDVIQVLGRDGQRSNQALYEAVSRSDLDELHTLLAGTAGSSYVSSATEKTGLSLKMTVQNQLDCFRFLSDEGVPFSIRDWVRDETTDSWMFITAREAMRDALKPVLSLWIDTAIKAVLDLEPIHRERLWFFIDELPTLQKLDVLKLALTNTRKYGLCCVIGVQDFSQLHEIYGRHMASTIISGCQTKLLLRVTDGEAAKLLAKMMGEAELDEREETLSYGINSQRDGVSIMARRQMRDVVLTSEILTLPDMHGYLMVPGDYPAARVSYAYQPRQAIAEGFLPRPGFEVKFGAMALSSLAGSVSLTPMTDVGQADEDGVIEIQLSSEDEPEKGRA